MVSVKPLLHRNCFVSLTLPLLTHTFSPLREGVTVGVTAMVKESPKSSPCSE